MEELIEKYQNLLRPIQSLEENWSVDLAETLAQAIESLSDHMVSFGHGGDKMLDFNKAAMIIRGSAHVYSKKVDYLHKSVYELKEWLEKLWEVEKKSRNRAKAANKDNIDLNLDQDDEDDDLDFSVVEEDDTLIDETKYVDQVEGSVLMAPKPPNLYNTFDLKVPLVSVSGDMIGYKSDFLMNSLNLDQLVTDQHVHQRKDSCESVQMAAAPEPCHSDGDGGCDETERACVDESLVMEALCSAPIEADEVNTPTRSEGRVLRARAIQQPQATPAEPPLDPWTRLLDPYATTIKPPKPLRPGNCRLLPPSLRKGKKRKTKGTKVADKLSRDIGTFCNEEYGVTSRSSTGSPLFAGFNNMFADVLKKKETAFKALRARHGLQQVDEEVHADKEELEEDNVDDFHPGEDEGNENVPFSRLQGELSAVMANDLAEAPQSYRDYLALVLQKQYEELATESDKLTDLDKRVTRWEKSVKQAVETSMTRAPFDMVQYSNSIFESFSGDQSSIPMDKLFQDKPKHEAFRIYVSTLTLANHGNVEIWEEDDEVRVSLLHKTTLSEVIASEAH